MKTIFVSGLFTDRNMTFLRGLCRRFRVITIKNSGLPSTADTPLEYAEDLVESNYTFPIQEFGWEMSRLVQFTGEQLQSNLSSQAVVDRDDYNWLFPMAYHVTRWESIFTALTQKTRIDLVLTNSDYQAACRPFVVMAKKMGIPTFCVEHGYWVAFPPNSVYKEGSNLLLPYASDVINFDNQLDLEALKSMHTAAAGTSQRFIALGTPQDNAHAPNPERAAALRTLGLPAEKKLVSIFTDWVEARSLSSLFRAQMEDAAMYQEIAASYSTWKNRDQVQLAFKFHPAFADPVIFRDVKNYLRRLFARYNLPEPPMYTRNLPEVIAGSDVMVTFRFSSVMWDGFLSKKPAIALLPRNLVDTLKDPASFKDCNILYKSRCFGAALSGEEIWPQVDHYLGKDNYQKYCQEVDSLKSRFQIQWKPVQQISDDIIAWIEKNI